MKEVGPKEKYLKDWVGFGRDEGFIWYGKTREEAERALKHWHTAVHPLAKESSLTNMAKRDLLKTVY